MQAEDGKVIIHDKSYKKNDPSTWTETTYNTDKGYFKFNIEKDDKYKDFNDKIRSIKIEGDCNVILFEDKDI